MISMKIANRNIFIDFDGTLVDIAPRHYRVYKKCVEKMGGTPLDRKKYWELKRDNISWNELLLISGLEVNNRDDYLELFIDRIESLEELYRDELFVDSLSALKKLSSNDNKLYLLSLRRNSDALDKQIEKLGIGCFFEKILSGHSDTKEGTLLKKADIIKQTIDNPEDSIIVGDTEADVAAAQQLNATSIALLSGIRSKKFLKSMEPDYLVDGIGDVANINL